MKASMRQKINPWKGLFECSCDSNNFKKNYDYNRGNRKYFDKTSNNGKKAGENVEEHHFKSLNIS